MPGGLLGAPAPIPAVNNAWHPEAIDWARRVTQSLGIVTQRSLSAVNSFCIAVQRAGIRERFYRCNLFAGGDLTACFTPLFRSSRPGQVLGNESDVNVGPFVSANYAETGAAGGLAKPDGRTTKRVETGVRPDRLPQLATFFYATSIHQNSITQPGWGASVSIGPPGQWVLQNYVAANELSMNMADANTNLFVGTGIGASPYDRFIGTRVANNRIALYRKAVLIAQNTTATAPPGPNATAAINVFQTLNGALCGKHYYAMGEALSPAQAQSLDVAFANYLADMGRV
jgi:hypothetical protein